MKKSLIIILTAILLFSIFNCKNKNTPLRKKKEKLVIKSKTIPQLFSTISKAIKIRNINLIRSLYTRRTLSAVKYNNKLGIGTAGSIDEKIMNEIETIGKKNKKIKILSIRRRKVLVQWPSGKTFVVVVYWENKGYRIDGINSPGGEILLLKE